MGKTGRLVRAGLRKEFVISFVGTFLLYLGVPATLASLIGGSFSIRVTSALAVVALLITALTHKNKLKPPWRVGLSDKKILRCPCDYNLTARVADLARYEFGRDTIPLVKYEPLRAKNPNILVCLTGLDGEFLGYFDVIPIKKSFAELFLQGKVSEKDLTHEQICSDRQMRRSKYVYLAGMAACDSGSTQGQVNGAILIWGLLKYLEHFYGKSEPYIFASAVNPDGEHLLKRFEVPLISEGRSRTDRHGMYGVCLSRELIAESLAEVPDYTLLCSLDWARKRKAINEHTPVPRRPVLPQKRRATLSV
jgi:hypothetical protein